MTIGTSDCICRWMSPLGSVTIASDGSSVTGLWFDGQKHYGTTLVPEPVLCDLPVFRETIAWLERYFSGDAPAVTPPLRLTGTPFQMAVWELLRGIPYGETVTYGELAQAMDPPTSPRAVGNAVGRNPISILIPCHRVMGAGGSLTGYAGGTDRKKALLQLEKVL